MKFSNLDIQEIQKTGPAYIPVNLTSINKDNKVETNLLCVHDDKGVLSNGKNVVWEATEANAAIQLLTAHENMVNDTKSILKTLKEKVINAANDSNTDADRATIQKEVDQALDQIDDNANVTFNGVTLIDGSKNDSVIETGTYTHLTNESFADGTNQDTYLVDLKNKVGDNIGIFVGDNVTVSYIKDGVTYSKTLPVVTDDDWQVSENAVLFRDLFDWEPCSSDLELADYPDASQIGTDQFGDDVHTVSGDSAISYRANKPGLDGQIAGLSITVTDKYGKPRRSTNTTMDNFTEAIRAQDPSEDNAIVLQTGTKANQSIKVGFTDMRASALGLKSIDGNTTFDKSLVFAINPKKLLDEARSTLFLPGCKYNKKDETVKLGETLLVFEDGAEINGKMTVYDVAKKYGKELFNKKVKGADSSININNNAKRKLYDNMLKFFLYTEDSIDGRAYRNSIKNVIKNLFDLAIEKCDTSLKTDKTKKNEFMKKKS